MNSPYLDAPVSFGQMTGAEFATHAAMSYPSPIHYPG